MSYQESGILVALKICKPRMSAADPGASQATLVANKADITAGTFSKKLFDKRFTQPIMLAAGAARKFHIRQTLPWYDHGPRLLPSELILPYMDEMNDLRGDFDAAMSDFVANYKAQIDESKERLGALFNAADYHNVADVAGQFEFATDFTPVPDKGDLRVDVHENIRKQLEEDITDRVESRMNATVQDCWTRLHERVSLVVNRLGVEDSVLRTSLIDQTVDLVELLEHLNITGDPNLEKMRVRVMNTLCGHEAAEIRESPALRESLYESGSDLLGDLEVFMS